jgi:hypothetical protein
MASTPKAVRKLQKELAGSTRKDRPISLKNATKQAVKKHAKDTVKSFKENYGKSSRKTLSNLGR